VSGLLHFFAQRSVTGKKVVVLGGGIGGLSAAHELAERGFSVEIFDLRDIPGGKPRHVTGLGHSSAPAGRASVAPPATSAPSLFGQKRMYHRQHPTGYYPTRMLAGRIIKREA